MQLVYKPYIEYFPYLVKILAMITLLDQQMPEEIAAALAGRLRARRKERRLTQVQLARKSGVSLGSLKRFEREHQIALVSLIKLAIALDCEADFAALFSKRGYASIQEVLDER